MNCVRCGALTSYKLSTKARDILGYSSVIKLCKPCMYQAIDYISNKGKSLTLQKGKITLFRKIKK